VTRYPPEARGATALLLGIIAPIGNVASAAAIGIEVKDLAFAPAEIMAHIGDTIERMNDDFVAHTATARDGQWDVKLPPHTNGRTIIRSAGKVEYYCRYHPNVKAVITVEPKRGTLHRNRVVVSVR
jgi:plastocyanin